MLVNHPYMEVDPDAGTMKLQAWDGGLLQETNLSLLQTRRGPGQGTL